MSPEADQAAQPLRAVGGNMQAGQPMKWCFFRQPVRTAASFANDRRLAQNDDRDQGKKPSLKQVVGSVLSAAFGVQSSSNRERDFKHGKARVFIVTGIVFTVLFIATVFLVVKLVLTQAGT